MSRAVARHLPSSLEPQAVMLPHLSLTGKSPWGMGPAGEDVLNSKEPRVRSSSLAINTSRILKGSGED